MQISNFDTAEWPAAHRLMKVDSHRFADTLSPAEFVVNHLADKRAMPTLLNLSLRGHVPGTITKVGTR
jgi:hypothetical protein